MIFSALLVKSSIIDHRLLLATELILNPQYHNAACYAIVTRLIKSYFYLMLPWSLAFSAPDPDLAPTHRKGLQIPLHTISSNPPDASRSLTQAEISIFNLVQSPAVLLYGLLIIPRRPRLRF